MSEFKIGDRVRVVAEHLKNRGTVGLVIDFDKVAYRVQFEDHRADWKSWYFDSEIEAAAPSASTVAEGWQALASQEFLETTAGSKEYWHKQAVMWKQNFAEITQDNAALQAKLDVATAALEEIMATTPEWEKDKPRDVLRLEVTATPNTQHLARQALARLKGEAHDS